MGVTRIFTGVVRPPVRVRAAAGGALTSSALYQAAVDAINNARAQSGSVVFTFDSGTADADPGAGALRLNNSALNLVTAAYVDVLDVDGADVSALLDSMDDSTNVVTKATLSLREAVTGKFAVYRVTGSVVDGTGYRKLTLVHVASSVGGFTSGNRVGVSYSYAGDKSAAAGADTQVQFRDGTEFAGDVRFVWNKLTGVLGASIVAVGSVAVQTTMELLWDTGRGGIVQSWASLPVRINESGNAVWLGLAATPFMVDSGVAALFGSYTDTSNNEYLSIHRNLAGTTPGYTITTGAAGTGVARDLVLSSATGHVRVPGTLSVGRGATNPLLNMRGGALYTGEAQWTLTFRDSNDATLSDITTYGTATPGNYGGVNYAGMMRLLNYWGPISINPLGFDIVLTTRNDISHPLLRVRHASNEVELYHTLHVGLNDSAGANSGVVIGRTDTPSFGNNLTIYSAYSTNPSHLLTQSADGAFHDYMGRLNFRDTLTGNTYHAYLEHRHFRLYNSRTDGSNGGWLAITYSSDICTITTASNGVGVAGALRIGAGTGYSTQFGAGGSMYWTIATNGHVTPGTNNALDLGSATFALRSGYFGTSLNVFSTAAGVPNLLVYGPSGDNNWAGGITLRSDNGTTVLTQITNNVNQLVFGVSANVIEQRNAANSQTMRWYETYTDSSNYSRAFVRFSSGQLQIGAEAAGTGTVRPIYFVSNGSFNFRTSTDAIPKYVIGPARVDLYASNDGANYERFATVWEASELRLKVEAGGTGTMRNAAIWTNTNFYWRSSAGTAQLTLAGGSSANMSMTLRPTGTGLYSIIDMLGENGTSVGATFQAGQNNLWVGADTHTFRKKDSSQNYLVLSTTVAAFTLPVRPKNDYTVATLPVAATVGNGAVAYVTDCTLAYTSANIGTAIAGTGGGANHVPVRVLNGAWVIG